MLKYHIDKIPDLRVSEPEIIESSLESEISASPDVFLTRETEEEFREMTGQVHGTIGRDGTDVHVGVTVVYATPSTCVRCLERFVRHGETGERTLFFHEKGGESGELERYGKDGWVSLAPWIRELILTDLPSYPLCDEACRGLCPQCGENRNTGRCTCSSEESTEGGA